VSGHRINQGMNTTRETDVRRREGCISLSSKPLYYFTRALYPRPTLRSDLASVPSSSLSLRRRTDVFRNSRDALRSRFVRVLNFRLFSLKCRSAISSIVICTNLTSERGTRQFFEIMAWYPGRAPINSSTASIPRRILDRMRAEPGGKRCGCRLR